MYQSFLLEIVILFIFHTTNIASINFMNIHTVNMQTLWYSPTKHILNRLAINILFLENKIHVIKFMANSFLEKCTTLKCTQYNWNVMQLWHISLTVESVIAQFRSRNCEPYKHNCAWGCKVPLASNALYITDWSN